MQALCKDIKKRVLGQHISRFIFLQGQVQFCFVKPFAFIYMYDSYWWNVQVFFNTIYYSETFQTLRVRTCYLQLWKCLFFNFFYNNFIWSPKTMLNKKLQQYFVFKLYLVQFSIIYREQGLLSWCSGKESACQCRRRGFDPWVGKIPWRRKWQPNPVFLPGKSMDRGACQTTVHGVTKSQTQLIRTHTHTHTHTGNKLEKQFLYKI